MSKYTTLASLHGLTVQPISCGQIRVMDPLVEPEDDAHTICDLFHVETSA
jgi:hypothetical protein